MDSQSVDLGSNPCRETLKEIGIVEMSDVPVLSFIEVNEHFICIIEHPNGYIKKHQLGLNYDTAIEQYLAMVESHHHSIQ